MIGGEGCMVHIGMRNLPLAVISRALTCIADFRFSSDIDRCIYPKSRFIVPIFDGFGIATAWSKLRSRQLLTDVTNSK